MKKRLTALLLSVLTAIASLGLFSVPAMAAQSSDFGMYVRKYTFHYYSDAEKIGFHLVLGAEKSYDVTYTVKLVDEAGTQLASWDPVTYYGGNKRNFRIYNLTDTSRLNWGEDYTLKVTGKCLANGKEQSFTWNFKFNHWPSVFNYTKEELGKAVKYEFLEYDYGDFAFNLWLSANEGYDATYKVRIIDPDGKTKYIFGDTNAAAWSGENKWKFSTKGMMADKAGEWTIRVDGMVDFDGIHNMQYWNFKYNLN
ncbi:MAG: hypothetical protein LBS19_15175 [Clostridiales bacterium]|nr:hypothetical protein [Clostridiales bacterium]